MKSTKQILLLVSIAVAVLTAACSDLNSVPSVSSNDVQVSFSFESPMLKTNGETKALDYTGGNVKFYFVDESYINIWSSSNTQCFYPLDAPGKPDTFKFEGGGFDLLIGSTYYALYPALFKPLDFNSVYLNFENQTQKTTLNTEGLSDYDFQVSSATCDSTGIQFNNKRVNAIVMFTMAFPTMDSDSLIFESFSMVSDSNSFAKSCTLDVEEFGDAAKLSDLQGKLKAITPGEKVNHIDVSLGEDGEGIKVLKGDTLDVFFSMCPTNVKTDSIYVVARTKSGKEYSSEKFCFGFTIDCNDFIHRTKNLFSEDSVDGVMVGSNTYPTINAAVAAITTSDTVKLLKDVVLDAAVSVTATQTVVIDLASHKLSASGVSGDWFDVAEGGSLKIKGPGEVAGWDPTAFLSDGYEALPKLVDNVQIFTVREKVAVTGTTEGYTEGYSDEKK